MFSPTLFRTGSVSCGEMRASRFRHQSVLSWASTSNVVLVTRYPMNRRSTIFLPNMVWSVGNELHPCGFKPARLVVPNGPRSGTTCPCRSVCRFVFVYTFLDDVRNPHFELIRATICLGFLWPQVRLLWAWCVPCRYCLSATSPRV